MILFVRDLTVIDFSYLCPTRGVLGESYIVDVELHGGLDATSMVLDFAAVKKTIKKAIDELIDHKLAYPALQSAVTAVEQAGQHILSLQSARGLIQVASPQQAHVAVPASEINEQTVAAFLTDTLMPLMPANVQALVFNLRAERTNGFYYHYTHGLKKHDGNCQRIAHGHRSLIEIYQNGMLSPRLNKYWSERWEDIYLGSAEDRTDGSLLRYLETDAGSEAFCYQSAQGWFEIVLPKSHVEIVPCDSTVECLSDYIADQLFAIEPASYKVVAYEGVGKGAISLRHP